jgi:integrase
MARKLPRIDHVKYVRKPGGKVYAYFNTGQKKDDKPIYARLPDPGTVGFFDSYSAFMAGRTKRAAPVYNTAALIADYLASATFAKLADNTRKSYKHHLAKAVDAWGKFPVDDLRPADVRFVLEGGRWPAGTAWMAVASLGAAYRWGRRNDKTIAAPTRDIEMPEIGSHDPWPEDVLEAALKSDDALIRLSVHLLYFTGQRIGDVMKMRWGDIRAGHVYVKQTKTGKVVEPPLMDELQAELACTPKTGLRILEGVKEPYLRRRLQAFTRALGVETVPHGLRKNAVNALLEAGSTVPEVAAITGQTHQVVEQYAAKVNRRKMGKAAIVKLEAARRK